MRADHPTEPERPWDEGRLGTVLSNSYAAFGRRGRVDAMEDIPGGAKLIRAFVPLANMFGYTNDIRSMSQGRAASTMELAQYEEVPPNVAQEIIEKRSK